jgi:hypothetical protein
MSNPNGLSSSVTSLGEFVENANPQRLKVSGVAKPVRSILVGDFIESANPETLEREFSFHLRDNRVVTVVGRDLKFVAEDNQPNSDSYAVIAGSSDQEVTVAQFAVSEIAGISAGEIRRAAN